MNQESRSYSRLSQCGFNREEWFQHTFMVLFQRVVLDFYRMTGQKVCQEL